MESLSQKIILQHVFLIYSDREGDSLKTMMKQLDAPFIHIFDLWKRKVGNAGNMIREHLHLVGSSEATVQLQVQTVGKEKIAAIYSLSPEGKIIQPKIGKETYQK